MAESTPSSNGSVGSSDLILILGSSVLSQIFFSVDVAVVRNPVKVRMMEKLTTVDSARRVPLGAVDLRVTPRKTELTDAKGVGVLLSKKNSGFSELRAVRKLLVFVFETDRTNISAVALHNHGLDVALALGDG